MSAAAIKRVVIKRPYPHPPRIIEVQVVPVRECDKSALVCHGCVGYGDLSLCHSLPDCFEPLSIFKEVHEAA